MNEMNGIFGVAILKVLQKDRMIDMDEYDVKGSAKKYWYSGVIRVSVF